MAPVQQLGEVSWLVYVQHAAMWHWYLLLCMCIICIIFYYFCSLFFYYLKKSGIDKSVECSMILARPSSMCFF